MAKVGKSTPLFFDIRIDVLWGVSFSSSALPDIKTRLSLYTNGNPFLHSEHGILRAMAQNVGKAEGSNT